MAAPITYIGRLSAFGLGKEATAGTAVTPTDFISVKKFEIKPITKAVIDTSAMGTIVKNLDVQNTQSTSETTLE
jgi:hypothetical protein